jgi:hypothetical protein
LSETTYSENQLRKILDNAISAEASLKEPEYTISQIQEIADEIGISSSQVITSISSLESDLSKKNRRGIRKFTIPKLFKHRKCERQSIHFNRSLSKAEISEIICTIDNVLKPGETELIAEPNSCLGTSIRRFWRFGRNYTATIHNAKSHCDIQIYRDHRSFSSGLYSAVYSSIAGFLIAFFWELLSWDALGHPVPWLFTASLFVFAFGISGGVKYYVTKRWDEKDKELKDIIEKQIK